MTDNPYSFAALWQAGDIVARGTIVMLAIMSMGTWYVLIAKFIEQARLLRQERDAARAVATAAGLRESADRLAPHSLFRRLIEEGIGAAAQHDAALALRIDRYDWIALVLQRATEAIADRLQSGLAVLATVASTAPFIGLFGTVWGIYHALTEIGIAGQASIDQVAGPVGEALIMTAMGLAVAVPAVLAYNWMVRRNRIAQDRVRALSGELLQRLISG